jgi:N-acetylmuramoyl-L-alanine amidase
MAVTLALLPSGLGSIGGNAFAREAPLIVIDPGHSGTSLTTIDPATQIRDEEYCNTPEISDVWDVAVILEAKLKAAGYRVLLTKPNAMATVSKRDRINVADLNGAALAVSIHTSGHTWLLRTDLRSDHDLIPREYLWPERVLPASGHGRSE